ncbi:DUF4405 domain-containing protein [Yersinia pestis]|uniref:Membrane protein n=14 Tax=Yersinia pestis TaxID=632 RepID=A0AAX2I636_YERPE|nr:DUF4405 domain-containing protein [Yersinia pestis]EDR31855.1 conserved hypothetical protein [Yersinia pestis biovar Orientalis str. IP275]EFA50173.1 putative membrane protein [Yersinia pestis KIM D27]ERP73612.1 membrane protein [Yersinia pestis S3]ERP73943.1 membrane protein [Yersinia pestis 24H]AAM85863.1 hypothetical [Yersinia pestis KIM10+]
MKAKYIFQVVQDMVMMIILLSLMGFHLWGESIHEWLGIAFLLIVLLHNGLNIHWIRKLAQGEYSAFRIVQVTVNIILALLFLFAIISGLMLSKHVLPDLPIHRSSDFVRKIHMTSVHWGQIFIAVHLGMHWKMLANFFCKIWRISPFSLLATRLMPAIFFSIVVYGVSVFMGRDLLPYLLIQVDFAFFDFEESTAFFYFDFFAITIFFAYLTRVLLWLFLLWGEKGKLRAC